MMIRFNENEVCKLIKATQYYRDIVTGDDEIWDRYNTLLVKLHAYGEETSPNTVSCDESK